MILEVAVLNIKAGFADEFEAAFKVASAIIVAMPGYISHELQHCLENCDRYILLLRWQQLEDHTDRKSTRLNSSHPVSSRMPSSA